MQYTGTYYNPQTAIRRHRRFLPHWQQDGTWTFVTWRLNDALPASVWKAWAVEEQVWRLQHPKPWTPDIEKAYHLRFSVRRENYLDEGHGSCVLRRDDCAGILADTLRHFHGQRYRLNSFVVMPNHAHVLFHPLEDNSLESTLKTWKGYSARHINKILGRCGTLWQPEYWDRLIRDRRHFCAVRDYIRQNPLKAHLRQGEYRFEEFGWEGVKTD